MVLPSHTTLVCAPGATIHPTVEGHLDDVATPDVDEYVLSVPDTAIAFFAATDVKIIGCTIEGFDFGIFMANNKEVAGRPTGNALIASKITAQSVGYFQLNSDDTLILGNEIATTSGAGVAINIVRNSDRNQVVGNVVRGSALPAEKHVPWGFPGQLPLSVFGAQVSNAQPFGADGIIVASGAASLFFNAIVDGQLYQFPYDADPPEDNYVAYNDIQLPGPISRAHRCGDGVRRERFVNNRVSAATGYFAGTTNPNNKALIPGSCSLDPARRCSSNGDCFFSAIDAASKGTCVGTSLLPVDTSEHDMHIEDNHFEVRLTGVQDNGSASLVISGNRIHGAGTGTGIVIGGQSLATGTVTRNRVSGMATALGLLQGTQASFSAAVSLNDFADNLATVANLGAYKLASELSAGGMGNYWGPNGFQLPAGSALAGLVSDSHPYCEPVAEKRRLPATCLR